jgi:hypothetical protein
MAVVCKMAISCCPASYARYRGRWRVAHSGSFAPVPLPGPSGGRREGLFQVDELGLDLGQRRGQRRKPIDGTEAGRFLSPVNQAQFLISNAWPARSFSRSTAGTNRPCLWLRALIAVCSGKFLMFIRSDLNDASSGSICITANGATHVGTAPGSNWTSACFFG